MLARLWNVEFDRDRFRPAVAGLLRSPDVEIRASAAGAWATLRGDLFALLPRVVDPVPGVRQSAGFALRTISRGIPDCAPAGLSRSW